MPSPLYRTLPNRNTFSSHHGMFARIVLAIIFVLPFPTHAGTATADIDQTVDAIWRVRTATLNFRSSTTHYPCNTLQQRVRDIMQAVGAAKPMDVSARCHGSVTNNTIMQIAAGVPVPATPENVEAETSHDSRAQLVAKVRRSPLPTNATVDRFRAVYTSISFARLRGLQLSDYDCDLLQGLSEQIFPIFDIRIRTRLHCSSGQGSLSGPRLVVDALLPLANTQAGNHGNPPGKEASPGPSSAADSPGQR